jgi:hypothetical protein
MAQSRQPKKRRRARSDPARRAAAARREDARRLAAEERRRAEETAQRRRNIIQTARRVGVPVLAGIAVIVAAIFLFRPQREIAGAERLAVSAIAADLGYELPAEIDPDSLPDPVCGVLQQPISTPELLYSDLYHGAVILWHAAGDQDAAGTLAELAADFDSHVVISPGPEQIERVVATSWERRKAYDPTDPELRDFIEAYRLHAPERGDCGLPE